MKEACCILVREFECVVILCYVNAHWKRCNSVCLRERVQRIDGNDVKGSDVKMSSAVEASAFNEHLNELGSCQPRKVHRQIYIRLHILRALKDRIRILVGYRGVPEGNTDSCRRWRISVLYNRNPI